MPDSLSFSTFLIGLFPIIAIIVAFFIANNNYKKGTYYKITKVPLLQVRSDIGKYGEYLIYKNLKKYEEAGAKFLFNVYIPKENDETTEIDVLMISSKGIFVFESKNYSGWIFGSENQRNWYQTLPQGRGKSHKEQFYNPIMQNNTHIKHLLALLEENISMYSIIAFSDRCTFKNVSIKSDNISVIHRNSVFYTVEKILSNNTEEILNADKITCIYNKLFPYTQVDEHIKAKHIENIIKEQKTVVLSETPPVKPITKEQDFSNSEEEEATSTPQEIADSICAEEKELHCPKCNSILILRTASKGKNAGKQFYGCSNFPKCRYIQKSDEA